MELFTASQRTDEISFGIPLAAKMRPTSLDEIVGQHHLLAEGKLLRRQIQVDRIHSLVFYGPPGVGKTSLGQVIAKSTSKAFTLLNAVTSSVADIKRAAEEARTRKQINQKESILFVDEIHRFNKAQQDVLLPHIENGTILFMGATTQNPFFYINSTLLSRSQLFELKPLDEDDIKELIQRALSNTKNGFGEIQTKIDPEALDHFAHIANGDGRKSLNALEIAVKTTEPNKEGCIHITLEVAEESIQKKQVRYDKGQDEHYNTASAFIKSIRGSDPDAALYWMAKMLHAGEDPRFIVRRLIVAASEDIGNADPRALMLATAALQAIEFLGMPEARIPLSQAVLYAACAPKSNASILAVDSALADIEKNGTLPVPDHLKDAHYSGAKKMGHGKEYQYPHNHEGHFVAQDYLSEVRHFFNPSDQGFEQVMQQRLDIWKSKKKNKNSVKS